MHFKRQTEGIERYRQTDTCSIKSETIMGHMGPCRARVKWCALTPLLCLQEVIVTSDL